jgi:hypothetical protein
MKKFISLLLSVFFLIVTNNSNAQLLKKLKQKAEDKIAKKVDGNEQKNNTPVTDQNEETQNSENAVTSGKPTNKSGSGLKSTAPPDVMQQIDDAQKEHDAGNYSNARYSIQQALIGVELQIGKEILRSLPETVNKLPKDTLQDKVTSTQWGWNNLNIQRVYFDKGEKQLTVNIGNNSVYSSIATVYFGGMYTQALGDNQNMKQVKVKGNKAVLQYDDSKGYTLIVPLGQSSLIVFECINFADENEVINSAGMFNIDDIKKRLGEQ